MAIGSRLIIRRLWPLKPTDIIRGSLVEIILASRDGGASDPLIIRNFYFLFYFSRHKLEISYINAQALKFHGSRLKLHGSRISISFGRLTALGFLQVNNLTATGGQVIKT